MKLYIMRHGRAEHNDLRIADEQKESICPLTEQGREQVEKTAQELKDVQFDVIYSSPLMRAQQTAQIVNENHDKPIMVDDRLIDIVTGFHREPWKGVIEMRAETDDVLAVKKQGFECLNDVKERIVSFVDMLRSMDYETVLIITHGDPIHAFESVINNKPLIEVYKDHIPTASVKEFEV